MMEGHVGSIQSVEAPLIVETKLNYVELSTSIALIYM